MQIFSKLYWQIDRVKAELDQLPTENDRTGFTGLETGATNQKSEDRATKQTNRTLTETSTERSGRSSLFLRAAWF